MMRNVGGIERAARVLVGLALLAIGIFHVVVGTVAVFAYIFGTVALATAIFAYCPAWTFGINTSRSKQIHAKATGSGE
jgi:hypothetical protein